MIKAPFEVGQVLINKYDYQIAVVERLDYRDSWYVLLAVGDERHWLAASTIQNQGFIPIDSLRYLVMNASAHLNGCDLPKRGVTDRESRTQ